MNKIIKPILLLLLAVIFSGCQQKYKVEYDYKAPKTESGQQCVAKCESAKKHCLSLCHANDGDCLEKAKQTARANYARYVKQRHVEGKVVINDLNSYYNPLQCEQFMCHCDEDYRACYRLCGGHTVKRRVCVKNCRR